MRARIERAGSISAADYVDMAQARARLTRAMDARLPDLDVLVMPTTPIVAPKMSESATPDTFAPRNGALLRNPAIVNSSISAPSLCPCPDRAAGRADAGRAQRPRCAAVPDRRGGGALKSTLTPITHTDRNCRERRGGLRRFAPNLTLPCRGARLTLP